MRLRATLSARPLLWECMWAKLRAALGMSCAPEKPVNDGMAAPAPVPKVSASLLGMARWNCRCCCSCRPRESQLFAISAANSMAS